MPTPMQDADLSAYRDGSIVRVAMHNFLTYDSAEFRPGPQLNMVVGPNGSGKSTLVCAICIGLGGAPSLLGRSPELKDYVRTGAQSAWVEVEIKAGNRTHTLRRDFTVERNTSTWRVDGRQSTEAEAKKITKGFNIQVDNLCQFLPQDRVVAFANMTPAEILKETEKAAGDDNLYQDHMVLIDLRKEVVASQSRLDAVRNEREHVVRRNAVLEPQVQRYLEREGTLQQLRLLKMRLAWIKYAVKREEAMGASSRVAEAEQALRTAQAEAAPLVQRDQDLQARKKAAEERRAALVLEIRNLRRQMDEQLGRVTAEENRIDEARAQLSQIDRDAQKRAEAIEGREAALRTLQEELARQPDIDLQPIDRELSALRARDNECAVKVAAIQKDKQRLQEEIGTLNQQLNRLDDRLREIDSTSTRRLTNMSKSNYVPARLTADAVRWLRDNKHRFQGEVYEPLILHINVKDQAYASVIEDIMSKRQFAFVVQNEHDFDLLSDSLKRLNLPYNILQTPARSWQSFDTHDRNEACAMPLWRAAQIRGLGFDCVAIDQIEAPDDIKAVLCDSFAMHAIPIARNEVNRDTVMRLDKYKRFYSGRYSYSVTKSNYDGQPILSQSDFRNASLLTIQQADPQARAPIQRDRDELAARIHQLQQEGQQLDERERQLRRENEPNRRARDELINRRKELATRRMARSKLEAQVVTAQRQLEDLRRHHQSIDTNAERTRLNNEINTAVRRRSELAVQYAARLHDVMAMIVERSKVVIDVAVYEAALQATINEMRLCEQRVREAQQAVENCRAAKARLVQEAKQLLETAKEIGRPSDEEAPQFERLPENIPELQALVEEANARLAVTENASRDILEAYENNKTLIAQFDAQILELEADLVAKTRTFDETKAKWYPRLTALIERISAKFSDYMKDFHNAGEVEIGEDDDYDKWSVLIKVKFRYRRRRKRDGHGIDLPC